MALKDSPIAMHSKLCVTGFDRVCSLLQSPDRQVQYRISYHKSCDERDRFMIWAGNIGALQDMRVRSSLDYRLRDAAEISAQVTSLLLALKDSLIGVSSIASGSRENRFSSASDYKEFLMSPGSESPPEDETYDVPTVSEIQELFQSASDNISHLFRLSILIRNATTRDRYARAAATDPEPFSDEYDIAHVGHKFPQLDTKRNEWLKIRLGKAIAWRRQYLRYCREHQEKLSMGTPDLEGPGKLSESGTQIQDQNSAQQPNITASALEAPSMAPSFLAPTTASTLVADAIKIPQMSDDHRSQVSYATSINDSIMPDILQVMPLEKAAEKRPEFICPYCWTVQRHVMETSWRKHVLNDLRPYVCTFQDCSMKIFAERRTWFDHEMQNHRLEWRCNFCSRSLDDTEFEYHSINEFKHHLQAQHRTQISHNLLPAMIQASQRSPHSIAPDTCPFCSEWAQTLRETNPTPPGDTLVVTPEQFMKHVGGHMVQLALFALPRICDNDQSNRSSVAIADLDQKSSMNESIPLHGDDIITPTIETAEQNPSLYSPLKEVFIAVMGQTGTGKTSFISNATGLALRVNHDLASCTNEIGIFETTIDGRIVKFIDTPGFDDDNTRVLEEIGRFLKSGYAADICLTGVIYLQRITDNRIPSSGVRSLRLLEKLCGPQNFGNVVLVTTMWDEISEHKGEKREAEFRASDNWRGLISKGATIRRHYRTKESADEIVRHLLQKKPVVLQFQTELAAHHGIIGQTAAGEELIMHLANMEQKDEKIKELRKEGGINSVIRLGHKGY